MLEYLTTIELIDEALQNRGFEKNHYYSEEYPILENDTFYARVYSAKNKNVLGLAVKDHFGSWSNSSNFELDISTTFAVDIDKAIKIANTITRLNLYDFDTFFGTIPLQG